jgi:hypothetical protein
MARTFVRFCGITDVLPTEWEAYVWLLNRFLSSKGNFFLSKYEGLKDLFEGRRGAVMFGPAPDRMNQPKRLSNGWYAETCLNEGRKDRNLYLLSQLLGISSEADYGWHVENRPRRLRGDVSTLKRSLKARAANPWRE